MKCSNGFRIPTFVLIVLAFAAVSASSTAIAADSAVLDFEAEVIEGQRKAPDLFLQTEVERPSLDTVLYQRKHFNDYHKLDSRQRPRASDPPR